MKKSKCKTIQSILNVNTRYLKRWLIILCSTEEYHKMFVNNFLEITDLESSAFEFQAYLKYTGRGQDISISQIKDSINKGDSKQLKTLLEELLLIPVDNTEIMKVLKISDYTNLEDFINEIKAYSNSRYVRVIDEYFYYHITKLVSIFQTNEN
ncbi:MAG TPA: hypothetical protein VIO64_04135 [Pseudobacteroides sp.]|uniref:hypothetical protein n=1 Tax=Pseudobacteroides sp. TaxID=1968840 RepID=UPI002F95A7C3